MYVEIPECRKCFCLPLRRGLLVFGYMGLIISFLWFTLEVSQTGLALGKPSITLHKGVSFLVQSWLVLILNLIDIAFNIVLVIGAHKKNTRLLRIYFYYGATTVLAGFVLFLVTRADVYRGLWFLHIEEAAFAVFWFGLQIFIILLVRSEIRKLKRNTGLRFVNHVSEVVVEVPPGEGNNPF